MSWNTKSSLIIILYRTARAMCPADLYSTLMKSKICTSRRTRPFGEISILFACTRVYTHDYKGSAAEQDDGGLGWRTLTDVQQSDTAKRTRAPRQPVQAIETKTRPVIG